MNEKLLGFIGLILPPVFDLVNTYVADSRIRFLITVGLCTLIGAVLAWLSGNVSVDAVVEMSTIIYTTASATYNLGWKKSDLREDMKEAMPFEESKHVEK